MIRERQRSRAPSAEMSVTDTTTTELAPVASAAADAASREPDAFEYPEGHWIAQSVWHGDAVGQAREALRYHFRDREDVLVAMELVVYYLRGDRTACLQPDVQVVFGVRREGDRSSYKVWEEGKAPDFVLEVASPSTAENDARHKAREYAGIGVREYWRLDPKGSLIERPLQGYEASGGRYKPVAAVGRGRRGRYLRSRVLGLHLRSERRDGATVLVFRDPRTGEELDGALKDAERRRQIAVRERQIAVRERRAAERRANAAESHARQEADLRRAAENRASVAEDRVRALERRLRNLTASPPPPVSDSQG